MKRSDKHKRVKVTLVKSLIGTKRTHRATVRGLGLRKINNTTELEYNAAVLGMLRKIDYLIKFEVIDAA